MAFCLLDATKILKFSELCKSLCHFFLIKIVQLSSRIELAKFKLMITYKLYEIARSTKGKKPKSVAKEKADGFEIPYVDIKAFEKGIVDNYTDGENCTFCKPDDVLIVWDGARCGFVGRGVEGAIGSTLAKISSDKYTNDFLFYFLQSKYKVLNSNPRGVGIPHIEPNLLWNFEIPDVDKITQHAIVSRIESLFAELDKAVQHLRTAQQQLKTYRQAVLNHWLNNEDGKWEMVKLGEVIEVKDGTHDTPRYVQSGIPFVTQKNITESGISFSNVQYITEQDHFKFHERSNVAQNDILIAMIGANRGNATIVNTDIVFSIKNVGLLKYAPNVFNNKFLLFYLRSQESINYIKNQSKGGAQEFIGLKELRNFPVSLPPLTEQQRIVKEIESRLSQATASETHIENALQQAEALKQSILKKAFCGELV